MRNKLFTLCGLLMCCAVFTSKAQVKIITTIEGNGSFGFSGDGGPASSATSNFQYMLALDAAGNLYFADNANNRIRKISTAGIITTVAGTSGSGGYTTDGIQATASKLNGPVGVAVDATGNLLYIGDVTNNRVRMVNLTTGIISTVAGTGTAGYSGDGVLANTAPISGPRGVAVDAAGNVYFADAGNARIRKIDASTNLISTVAGNGTAGFTSDAVAATTSEINNPRGLAIDALGNLYIADMANNRIRMVDATTSFIYTVAGTGTSGYTGDGTPAISAQISGPTDVKFDGSGNMYIADANNNHIRMVNTTGTISTVAGGSSTTGAFAGDWGPATAAAVRLNGSVSIAPVSPGIFYISDRNNSRIRFVRNNSIPTFVGGSRQSLSVCQGSGATSITSLLAITDGDRVQTETWTATLSPVHGTLVVGGTQTANGGTVSPSGASTYTPAAGYSGLDSFYVKISDGLDFSIDTIIVTINPLPVVAGITGTNNVCQGASVVLNDATPGGVWTSTTGAASVVSGTVTGVSAGTDLISYTVTNACGSVSATYAFTVNPLPDAGTITGVSSVCVGSTVALSDGAAGGAWSASNSNATVVGGFVTGVAVGSVDISYTVSNTCGTAYATFPMTVITSPTAAPITGATSVCVSATTPLSDATSGGVWTVTTGNAGVSSGGVVTGLTAGTDVISYTVTNACGSDVATYSVTINPLPDAGTITGPVNVCVGSTITLTDAVPGGAWSSSASGVASVSGGVVTGVSVGSAVISYSVTNVCGTAVATSTIAVVTVPSAGTLSGPSSVCESASITLTPTIAGGTWSASNANATVVGGVVTGVTAGTDVISYSVTYPCGTAVTTFTVTINPLPNPGTITGPSTVCIGLSITLADAVTGGTWSATNGHATVSSTGLVTSVSVGIDTILYSVTNGCGTVAATHPVSVNPIVTPSVSFTASPGFTTCAGTPVTYTAVPVNGGASPTYEWRVNGLVAGSGSSVTYTPSNGDQVVVNMTSSMPCVSTTAASDTQVVTVNPLVAPSVTINDGIIGDTVCVGTVISYTAVPVNGGSAPSYQWYVNGALTGIGLPFVYVPVDGDVITTVMTSSYACAVPTTATSNSISMTVDITQTPTVTISANPGSTVCIGSSVTMTAYGHYGGLSPFYRWTKNGINVGTGRYYTYTPSNGDNVYCMLASSSSCRTADSVFSSHMIMSTISPVPPTVTISATPGTNVGIGDSVVLSASVAGATVPNYQWYVNSVAVPGANSSTFVYASSSATTAIITCVAGTGDACNATAPGVPLVVHVGTTGIKQAGMDNSDIQLVPNPNNGTFTIEGNMTFDNKEVAIEIVNAIGQVMYRDNATVSNGTLNKQVNTSNTLVPGVYMLHLVTGNEHKVIRFNVSK